MAEAITLPWVRARGRALLNCVRTIHGKAIDDPLARGLRGGGELSGKANASQWRGAFGVGRPMDPTTVDPLAVGRLPRDRRPAHRQWCHQWHTLGPCVSPCPLANGTSNGMQSLRVQTVLQCAPPCAHQRHRQCSANGQVHRKNLSTWQKALQKASPAGLNFFQLFS